MKRWLFHIVAGLSLLLFVATMAMWVRSCFRYDRFDYDSGVNARLQWTGTVISFEAVRIWLTQVTFQLNRLPEEPPLQGWSTSSEARPTGPFTHTPYYPSSLSLDFGISRRRGVPTTFCGVPGTFDDLAIRVPLWTMALAFAMLPCCWVILWYRRQRIRPGICTKCGYDLRASKDRCPECGTPIPAMSGVKK